MEILYIGLIAAVVGLLLITTIAGLGRGKRFEGVNDRIAGNQERLIELQERNVAALERIAVAVERRSA